ncbi:MAG: hypothetical protein PVF29_01845 [Desulfobacterales bacterium]
MFTQLSLRMTQEGFSTLTIGMTMACYFMGLIFAVYPLAVARANDVLEGKEAVAISSALLLCYSIGAIFGPVMASITLTLLKTPYGLFCLLVSGGRCNCRYDPVFKT